MESCVLSFLERKGYRINTSAMEIINTCDDWYANRKIDGFHERRTLQGDNYELSRLNFAKRCCSDDANLCEVIEIKAGDGEQNRVLNKILSDSKFITQNRTP